MIGTGIPRWLSQFSRTQALTVAASPGAGAYHRYSGVQLLEASHAAVEALDLPQSSRSVLLLLPHSQELFLLHLGLVLTGRVPAILPWPTVRVDAEKYRRNLLFQLQHLPADHLVTVPALAASLAPALAFGVSACAVEGGTALEKALSSLSTEPPAEAAPGAHAPVALPDDALFLQFSGGTTGTQKCVVVTERLLEAQLRRLASALGVASDDTVVSWLPMYHDMGLIGCLWLPLWAGIPSVQIAASDWLMRPEILFELMQDERGTLCWLPNFAFSYLAQRRTRMEGTYALGHVKAWTSCSEPVRAKSMAAFLDAFGEWGVTARSLQASYAMAENVFAVTQTPLGRTPQSVRRSSVETSAALIDRSAFEVLDDVHVSSGRCLEDMEVRVMRSDRTLCDDREAGEIQIATPSLFEGYWSSDGFSRDAFMPDGWYATGDYGFLSDGELYVIGRLKDIIIVGGQNVFPEDIEALANGVSGVYPGRVVAFAVDDDTMGTQSVAVVAEMSGAFDGEKAQAIAQEVRQAIVAAIGIAPRHVQVMPERWIVKSTAGKISRRDTRERFLQERMAPAMRDEVA